MFALFRSLFAPPRHLILPVVALLIGLVLAEKRTERNNVSTDALNNIVFYSILGYVIGGRILYALTYFSVFRQSPLSLFSINPELFDPLGALLTAILVGFVYGQRNGLALWSTLDSLTPLFATLAVGLSLAHLAAGTAFGSPSNLPWGVDLWGATRHPSQIYEFFASLLILGLMWFRKMDSAAGSFFLTFTALTAGSRLFFEAFRGDSTLIVGGLRLTQVIAWIVLGLALFASEEIHRLEKAN